MKIHFLLVAIGYRSSPMTSLFFLLFFYMRTTTVELPLWAITLACLTPSLSTCLSPLHHHLLLLLPHPVSLLTDFEGCSTSHRPPSDAKPDPLATPPASSALFSSTFLSVSLVFSPFIFASLLLRSSAGLFFFRQPVPRVTPHELFMLGGEFCSVS